LLAAAGEVTTLRVLDVGCGDGVHLRALADRGIALGVGLDLSPTMLHAARVESGARPLHFVRGDALRLPFPSGCFDLVWMVTVLCFVADSAAALQEAARVLRPGGRLVLADLGRWSSWAALRRVKGWLGSAAWRDAHFRSAGELRRLASVAGLGAPRVHGAVCYPPVGVLARALEPLDPWSARLGSLGAAFLVLTAEKGAR
jgi:SAM-dependent methyltransferase